MCRGKNQRPPHGKRCPCHSDPVKRKAATIRQRISRYSRGCESAELAGDEATANHKMHLFEAALNDLAQHDEWVQRRTKPPTRAAEFTIASTAEWSDRQLAAEYHRRRTDPQAQEAILAVMEHRDEQDELARQRAERTRQQAERACRLARKEAEAAQQAWSKAQPFDPPPVDPLHNPARRRGRQLSKDEQVREEYTYALEAKYLEAEEVCNGAMLNRRGIAAGVDPYTLFSGTARRAKAYGSDELLAYFREHGRLTYGSFRYARLGWESDYQAAASAKREDYGHVA